MLTATQNPWRPRPAVALVLVFPSLFASLSQADVPAPLVEKYLHSGDLAGGEKALVQALERNPKDDRSRFGLGVLQALRAVERLTQHVHRSRPRLDGLTALGVKLDIVPHPKPRKLTYAGTRRIIHDLLHDLARAEKTLAGIRDDGVKLSVRFGLLRLDLDGDGKPDEPAGELAARLAGAMPGAWKDKEGRMALDRGDVAWLRGYCHLIQGVGEIILAHDWPDLFDHLAPLLFREVETPYPENAHLDLLPGAVIAIAIPGLNVLVAGQALFFAHLAKSPVTEPARMRAALAHFEQVVALNREMWKHIQAETDDDNEWIPNSKQTGVLRAKVTQEMIAAWLKIVDESEAVLAGKRLLPYPFWKPEPNRGINVRTVFLQPRTFDPITWAVGTGGQPFMEKGEVTQANLWEAAARPFGGWLPGYAAWFN